MFSAYDLKKIIPRAIFALVAVNLSWGLMQIFITAIGALGEGTKTLIQLPFQQAGISGIQLGGGGGVQGAATLTLAGLGAAGVAFGLVPVLGVAITGLFGILFAFVIALLRRVILIGLVMIAPVAIALSVFPQTEDYAKKWWEWFSKLLLMYPFVMAFFALSEVVASLLSMMKSTGSGGFDSTIYDLAAIAVLIVPYFLVGKALTLAGGAIGKVAGMVNNKDRGMIDKTKKWEAGKVADRRYDAARGQRYGGRNFVTKGINRTLRAGARPSTVVGRQGNRDAAILGAVQENAGSMESRHEGAKTLTKDQIKLLGSISDESQAGSVMDALAREKAAAKGDTSAMGIAAERSALQAAYNDAKNKVGGTVDTGSQLYALQKGVQDGSISPEEAAEAATQLSRKLATGGGQQERLAATLHSQLDSMATGAGYVTGNAVTRQAQAARSGSGSPPPAPDHAAVQRVYSGATAASFDTLGGMKSEDFQEVADSKQQQAQNTVIQIGASATVADARPHIDTLVGHRADLEVTRRAAVKAGNSTLVKQTTDALADIDRDLDAAEARGAFGGHTTAANVRLESGAQADTRTRSTP